MIEYEKNILILPCPAGKVSDGFHTFEELYAHRHILFVKLMNSHPDWSWKSWKHDDGSMYEGGFFVAGMRLPTGDISYHLDGKYWDMVKVQELDFAPAWDGYTSEDVWNRLSNWEQGE